MNEDVLKSFECKEINCGLTFFSEDLLNVHQQSNHTKLNLEIPDSSSIQIFSDQTPTPTQLLNNCEELRVFDDLQNINPFDEGFRRAVEDGSNGIARDLCSLDTPSNQDTLHTPQILTHFESRLTKHDKSEENKTEIPIQDEPENLSLPTSIEDIPTVEDVKPLIIYKTITNPIPLLPKPNIIYAAPLIQNTMHLPPAISADVMKTSASVKDKLKSKLNSNGSQADKKRMKLSEPVTNLNLPTILIGSVPLIATAPAKIVISNNDKFEITSYDAITNQQVVIKPSDNEHSSKKRTRSDKSETTSLKVERNRAAARRYRNKMKIQSQALQEKYEKSQRELSSLKKELLELKKLLLLHKDCPVTRTLASSKSQQQQNDV